MTPIIKIAISSLRSVRELKAVAGPKMTIPNYNFHKICFLFIKTTSYYFNSPIAMKLRIM